MNEPIDEVHAMSLNYINRLRLRLDAVRAEIARWEPRPCPPHPPVRIDNRKEPTS